MKRKKREMTKNSERGREGGGVKEETKKERTRERGREEGITLTIFSQ